MDDKQRRQVRQLYEYLDVHRDGCIAPKLAAHLCHTLGFEVAFDEMDASEGLTLEDVLHEVDGAFVHSQGEPMERLAQIHQLVAGASSFVTVAHVRAMLENAQAGVLEQSGGPPTDTELQELIDAMVFNPRPEVKHATRREFEEFVTVAGPRALRLKEPFDARPDESMAQLAQRAAIPRPEHTLP